MYPDSIGKTFFFEYQKEYRIVIPEIDVEDHFELDLGDMSSFTNIVPIEDLLTGRIVYRFGYQ
jgi:hypothetical protein